MGRGIEGGGGCCDGGGRLDIFITAIQERSYQKKTCVCECNLAR